MELTTDFSTDEIKNYRNINNFVFIDVGDTIGNIRQHTLDNGNVLYLSIDPDYLGFAMLKRLGKVLSVPNKLKYQKPYELKERIENIVLNVNDIVFFEPETKSICEQQGYKPTEAHRYSPKGYTIRTKEKTTVYVVSYHLLICAIDRLTKQIKMLNGKVLVKRFLKLTYGNTDIQRLPDAQFNNTKSNWCEIVIVSDEEDYQGVYLAVDVYADMNYFKQTLEKGMQILIKKTASFNIQSVIKEDKNIEELQNTYTVSRHNIMAYRQSEHDESIAYGLYIKVKPDEKEEKDKYAIVVSEDVDYTTGTVLSIGNGVTNCNVGDNIAYYKKNDDTDGYHYIHNEWVVLI